MSADILKLFSAERFSNLSRTIFHSAEKNPFFLRNTLPECFIQAFRINCFSHSLSGFLFQTGRKPGRK
ncbi:hypothetical protein HMPREF9442_00290 [Paraprevotella xylaniphila YIT 11841]|uniref:Uncharacterized protein n=1 Tax=Paraprevotella xylaniphila YIT 11841 TaxID=762982 RepID=F3QQ52_9BACT|nr:hypothetical protein HMPREF9442_00290 [Paraprevotella xylaniphila YIT 11841]